MVTVKVLGAPTEFSGIQAATWAVVLGFQMIIDSFAKNDLAEKFRLMILAIAGLSSILFILMAFATIFIVQKAVFYKYLIIFSLLGIASATAVPFVLVAKESTPLFGYFLWLLGYCLQLISLINIAIHDGSLATQARGTG